MWTLRVYRPTPTSPWWQETLWRSTPNQVNQLGSQGHRRMKNIFKFFYFYFFSLPLPVSWDCVATCFFIDTAHNVIEYVETIWKILKPGGVWINLGERTGDFTGRQNSVELQTWDETRLSPNFTPTLSILGPVLPRTSNITYQYHHVPLLPCARNHKHIFNDPSTAVFGLLSTLVLLYQSKKKHSHLTKVGLAKKVSPPV